MGSSEITCQGFWHACYRYKNTFYTVIHQNKEAIMKKKRNGLCISPKRSDGENHMPFFAYLYWFPITNLPVFRMNQI